MLNRDYLKSGFETGNTNLSARGNRLRKVADFPILSSGENFSRIKRVKVNRTFKILTSQRLFFYEISSEQTVYFHLNFQVSNSVSPHMYYFNYACTRSLQVR